MLHRKIGCILFIMAAVAVLHLLQPGQIAAAQIPGGDELMKVERISAKDAYDQVKSGKALLVCAYEKEEACRDIMLEGAITFQTFEERLPEIRKDQPIIFYCQ